MDANNVCGYAKFLPICKFKWIDPKRFGINKYTNNSSKGCLFKLDLEFPKELRELRNDYPFDSDKIEIKKKCSLNIN